MLNDDRRVHRTAFIFQMGKKAYLSNDLTLKRAIDHLYFDVSQAFINQQIVYTDIPKIVKIVCEECERAALPVNVDKKDLVIKIIELLISQRSGDEHIKTYMEKLGEPLIEEYIKISKHDTLLNQSHRGFIGRFMAKTPAHVTEFYRSK